MIDLVAPDERFSVQRFTLEATRVLHRLAAAGHIALVVGGTGYYVRALLDRPGIPEVPPDPVLRARLTEEVERAGNAAVHARLAKLDPASAIRVHPNNTPRLLRALEIVERLGGPVPNQPASRPIQTLYLGLDMERAELRRHVDERVKDQIRAGLVDETRLLLAMGYDPSLPSLSGLGYREMVAFLQGRIDLPAATNRYQMATHQYVRKQRTWFRSDQRIVWLDSGHDATKRALEEVDRWIAR
jgi:tRNA dimethylallyltransferase